MDSDLSNLGKTLIIGILDAPHAAAIVDAVRCAPVGSVVTMDFSRSPAVHDCALALLSRALEAVPSVSVRAIGLCGHSSKLLTYLGVEPGTLRPLQSRASSAPEFVSEAA